MPKRTLEMPLPCDSQFSVAENDFGCDLPLGHRGLHSHTGTEYDTTPNLPTVNYLITWDHDPDEPRRLLSAYVRATTTQVKDTKNGLI